jgi:DNA-binding transcriptional LysR family regulator
MDLTQIRYFLALARTLNFTRAAEACNVTQPALTKSIQRLEDELGGPLLLRERLLTQLTPLGQAMLPLLEQTHAASERAKEHAASLKRDIASPLRVGLALDVPADPFLPLFRELAARLPGFGLDLRDAPGADLADALLHGTLDVAVVTGDAALPDRLNRWPLFTDAAMLVVPPGHALDGQDGAPVPVAALHGTAVVYAGPDCGMARLLVQAGQVNGAQPGQRHRAGTTDRAADLVRAGLGVTILARRARPPLGLRLRPIAGQAPHDVLLVAVAGRPFPRAADTFIKLARARDWEMLDAAA